MVKWKWLIIADDDPLGRNPTFDTACAADEQRAGQKLQWQIQNFNVHYL